ASDVATGAEIDLIYRDASDAEVGTRLVVRQSGATSGVYQQLSGSKTVPANTVRIQIRVVQWTQTVGATYAKFQKPMLLATSDSVDADLVYPLGAPASVSSVGDPIYYVATTGNDTT